MALDYDRVSLILVEAVYFGEKVTADKQGVSLRTIQNYRTRLKTDSKLAQIFALKKQLFEQNWTEEISLTTRMAMRFIQRASVEMTPSPEATHAIAGALKIVAEIGLTKDLMDVRLGKVTLSNGAETQQLDTGSTDTE